MSFYVDAYNNLRPVNWVGTNTWNDLGIVSTGRLPDRLNFRFNGNVSNNIVLDEINSPVYFIGQDKAVYYYTYSYNTINPNSLVKLGQNATESNNAGSICDSSNNAGSDLILSKDKNELFYFGSDGSMWYWFNDKGSVLFTDPQSPHNQYLSGPNWNKTCFSNDGIAWPYAVDPTTGNLFSLDYGGNLHYHSWVNADVPSDCPNSNDAYIHYKNAITNDSTGIKAGVSAVVFPNPSEGSFTIAINNVDINTDLQLSIENIDGNIIYQRSGYVSNGSGTYQFLWDARTVSSGIYFYRVELKGKGSYSGKMIKL